MTIKKPVLLLLLFAVSFLILGGGMSQAAPTPESYFSEEVINGNEIKITKCDK